jgi:hypothetical protein
MNRDYLMSSRDGSRGGVRGAQAPSIAADPAP